MNNKRYFDEMNLLESDKETRIQMCDELSDSLYDDFQKYDKDSVDFDKKLALILTLLFFKYGILDETITSVDVCISYVDWKLDTLSSEMNSYIDISKSTLEILNEITDDAKSISDTTAKTIESEYSVSRKRAEFIARNITNKYNNANNHKIAVKNGAKFHYWRAMNDGRERESHKVINGQKRKINEPFEVNGYYMMYPMDGQYGASAEEIMNCRCTETFSVN